MELCGQARAGRDLECDDVRSQRGRVRGKHKNKRERVREDMREKETKEQRVRVRDE